jgi:hypothetical protein
MIEYLPFVLTGLGLTASIIYYTNVLRNQNKTQQMQLETRQAQLYNNIWNQSARNPQFQKNYMKIISLNWNTIEEYKELFPRTNPSESELTMALWDVGLFFEGLVPIIKEGLLDIKYLEGTIGHLLSDYWMKFEPLIEEIREYYGEPMFDGTEWLNNELKKTGVKIDSSLN